MEIAARSQPVPFVLLDDHRSPDPAVAADGDHGVDARISPKPTDLPERPV
jgi:hypothetical protein